MLLTITIDVKKLVHFVRSPTWITPPQRAVWGASPNAEYISSIQIDENDNFTQEQIEVFEKNPDQYMKFVKVVEKEINSKFKMVGSKILRNYKLT